MLVILLVLLVPAYAIAQFHGMLWGIVSLPVMFVAAIALIAPVTALRLARKDDKPPSAVMSFVFNFMAASIVAALAIWLTSSFTIEAMR